MEFHDYVRVLHKNWILIVVCLLAGVGLAAAYSLIVTPKYQASTELYVSVRSGDAAVTGDLVQGTTFARQAVTSYVDVVDSAIVLDRVIEELQLDSTTAELAAQVVASSPLNTVLIDITVTDSDPERAAAIANATGANLADVVVNDLEKPEGDSPSLVKIETIQPATVPAVASSPNVFLNLVLGALIGLAIGIGIAVLRTVLDTRIHSLHDIAQVTDTPLLGGIALDPGAKKRPLIVHSDPRNPRAESFRSLRTNLQFVNIDGSPRSFVISSAGPGEGKSTTTANLAISLAETGAKVALVDGDLRMPKLAEYLGIEGGVGLTDVLIGRAEIVEVLQKWGRGHLYVLPAGRIPPNPSELLGSGAMARLLETLTSQFDYVLIDSPPLLLVTDAAVVSKLAGGAILVAASGSTKKQELAGAVRALESIGSRLLGIIVTMLPTKGPDSYSYGAYTYGVTHDGDEFDVGDALDRSGRSRG
ncbi:capsular exopolysaccharide synthesis family protein [Agromyces sp. 3263]|uniref:polysaccharide biosynthesis tyrosine autokinase n=1 Tax=Agromyces sp. 3263 TaxID=2817750 RepID=UPI002854F7F3|nr:polysaccharide biosynthesis tyrosine autokinase [Agromyces sp. 3263]MDR6904813.1 capsular exopolysaccharide synthesis family protein [Agromyces sp. 3263]